MFTTAPSVPSHRPNAGRGEPLARTETADGILPYPLFPVKTVRIRIQYDDRHGDTRFAQAFRYAAHLVERWCYKAAQAYEVDLAGGGFLDYLLRGDHHPEVYHLEVVAGENDACDILAYVVDVALDGGCQESSRRMCCGGAAGAFNMRAENLDGAFHRACRLHHLRQEHLACAE